MDKKAGLFLRTPRGSGDSRVLLAEELACAKRYADQHGLQIVQSWIAEEDPDDPDQDVFCRFAELMREDPEIDAVLLRVLEDAALSLEDLLAIASLLLEEGLEIHSFLTGHCIEAPPCEEELLDLEGDDRTDEQDR